MRLFYAVAALSLAVPAQAQDIFPTITGVLSRTNSVAFFYTAGRLSDETAGADSLRFEGATLYGAGVEVLVDLPTSTNVSAEFGLSTSFARGLRIQDGGTDLALTYRTLPRLAFYLAYEGFALQPYGGLNFGAATLWNATAASDSARFNVSGSTYSYGASGGLTLDFRSVPFSPFVEVGFESRRFGGVRYERITGPEDAVAPASLPLELDLSTAYVEVGLQFGVADTDDRSLEGVWLLGEVDGVALPFTADVQQATEIRTGPDGTPADTTKYLLRTEYVGGVLTFDRAHRRHRAGNYELNVVQRTVRDYGTKDRQQTRPVVPYDSVETIRGGYDVEEGVLRLCAPRTAPRSGEEGVCEGDEAPGGFSYRVYREGEGLVLVHPNSRRVLTFTRSPD